MGVVACMSKAKSNENPRNITQKFRIIKDLRMVAKKLETHSTITYGEKEKLVNDATEV